MDTPRTIVIDTPHRPSAVVAGDTPRNTLTMDTLTMDTPDEHDPPRTMTMDDHALAIDTPRTDHGHAR